MLIGKLESRFLADFSQSRASW